LAQDICAKQEPPLLQIGPRHKVACHFAGEEKSEGAVPMTLSALGCDAHGDPIAGQSPQPDLDDPGYTSDYQDLETRRRESAPLANR
jgi:peptide/nickel transport system ATP-binding protein/oligopeptide transport system ATP-binding protein